MSTYPFSVFKRHDRPSYLVSFKDADGNYLPPLSTKKKTEEEAKQVAFMWLRDGIPQKKEAVKVNDLSMKNMVRGIKTDREVKTVLDELQRSGWVKGGVLKGTNAARNYIEFLKTFWDWDESPYVKEKLRKNHGIHKRHCKQSKRAISLYYEDFFKDEVLGEITAEKIENFINHMAGKDLSPDRKNVIIKAGYKPLRWAFAKGWIETDPTRGHILFSGNETKRNILTPLIASGIFRIEWNNERAKIGNMLAAVTGMRCGEFQGLRLRDLGKDCLYVSSSWNSEDNLKTTKNNESRIVEVPFPELMNMLFALANKNPWGVTPDSYVFYSEFKDDIPMDGKVYIKSMRKALVKIGLTKEQAELYTFHGWRHFYTSYMIKKLDKKLLKTQTGHKTDCMVELYADHETVGDRQEIQNVQRVIFAGLLPQKVLLLEDKRENKSQAA